MKNKIWFKIRGGISLSFFVVMFIFTFIELINRIISLNFITIYSFVGYLIGSIFFSYIWIYYPSKLILEDLKKYK